MTNVTLLVAVVFSVLAISKRNTGASLGILVMSMLFWPDYLRVQIGMDLSVARVTAFFLLIKFSFFSKNKYKFDQVDKLVIGVWVWTIVATALAGASSPQIISMAGRALDTVVLYFVARRGLNSLEDIRGFFFGLAVTAVVFGILGFIEATYYYSPYQNLYAYRTFVWIEKVDEYRHGFLRAKASLSVHIYFGLTMAIIFGMLMSIKEIVGKSWKYNVALYGAGLATISSMSSGPWICMAMIILFQYYYKKTHLIKPTLLSLLVIAILLEMISNRHFYHLIDYLALNSQTAWYRTKLLEVAFQQWQDFFLFGVGSNMPHHWAMYIDGRNHVDVVNNFLIVALYGGIFSLLMFIGSHYLVIKKVVRVWPKLKDIAQKRLLFGLSATLVSLDFASMSVSFFTVLLMLSYFLLGFLNNCVNNAERSLKV